MAEIETPHPRDVFVLEGQDAAQAAFEDARGRGRLHHAWLLTGPEGVGKATFAYRAARRLLGAPPAPDYGPLGAEPDHPVSRQMMARSHPDILVNFVICTEQDGDKFTTFTWVTDLPVAPKRKMLPLIERGGRARWKVENETFNTLKNQGYHFEHNYGHGFNHLSTVLMLLMMLAFLVDQTQQIACPLFRAAYAEMKSRRGLWEKMRALFFEFAFQSMAALYETIVLGHARLPPVPLPNDSS